MHRNAERGERMEFGHVEVRNPKQRLPTRRNVDNGRQWLRKMRRAVGGLSAERTFMNCVRVAAAVEQEELVLVVGEALCVEGHADAAKIRVQGMQLDPALDIIP